jgi:hypothetical protein
MTRPKRRDLGPPDAESARIKAELEDWGALCLCLGPERDATPGRVACDSGLLHYHKWRQVDSREILQ